MKKSKSIPKSLIIVASIAFIIVSVFTIPNISANLDKPRTVRFLANVIDMQKTIEEAINNGDTIVSGKVKSSYSYKLNNIIFTNYIISVNNKFKNKLTPDIPNEIEVRVTGGNFEGESFAFLDSAKELTKNEKYLFILNKAYPDQQDNNFYNIIGGQHQGVFKLDGKDTDDKIVKFNPDNNLEKDLIGKNIKDILKK